MSIVLIDSTSDSLTVSWPTAPGAERYVLEFKKTGGEFETLSDQLTTAQARKKNLTDPDLAGFVFRVSAVGHDDTTNTWISHSEPFYLLSTNEAKKRMDPPTVALSGKNETLMISWTPYDGAKSYDLQMRENEPGAKWVAIATSLSRTDVLKRNLSTKHGYQFRVRPDSPADSTFSSPSDSVFPLGLSDGLKRQFWSLEKASLLRNVKDPPVPLADALGGKELVLLYASAHWCPPCRKYTPVLSQWYQSLGPNKTVEVVFLSADHDEKGFRGYYQQMPWLAIPFDDDGREKLMGQLHVSGIPRLVVLDGRSGRILQENAVGQNLDVNRWRGLQARKWSSDRSR
jgi:thiol-disulfide isomerase/thioredoxin